MTFEPERADMYSTALGERSRNAFGDRLPMAGEVCTRIPLPEHMVCMYLSGSLIDGWSHERSDLDVYVITSGDEPFETGAAEYFPVTPPRVPKHQDYVDAMRWDVEYWTERQVDDVLDKVASPETAAGVTAPFSYKDADFLYRLLCSAALSGEVWLEQKKDDVRRSRFRELLVARLAKDAGRFLEDVDGLLTSGDFASAVLAAREGYAHAVDAAVAASGEFAPSAKWRARKVERAARSDLPFAEYWSIETMAGFDCDDPAPWVRRASAAAEALLSGLNV